jgi:hypothetical protein
MLTVVKSSFIRSFNEARRIVRAVCHGSLQIFPIGSVNLPNSRYAEVGRNSSLCFDSHVQVLVVLADWDMNDGWSSLLSIGTTGESWQERDSSGFGQDMPSPLLI